MAKWADNAAADARYQVAGFKHRRTGAVAAQDAPAIVNNAEAEGVEGAGERGWIRTDAHSQT